LHGREGDLIKN